MIEIFIIISILLILSVVYYLYNKEDIVEYFYEEDIDLINNLFDNKYNNILTNVLELEDNICYLLFFKLNKKISYWTISTFIDNNNFSNINMSRYHTPNFGDMLVVFLCNNENIYNRSLSKFKCNIDKKIYYSLYFDKMYVEDKFHINIKLFSNINCFNDLINIKKYTFNKDKNIKPFIKKHNVITYKNTNLVKKFTLYNECIIYNKPFDCYKTVNVNLDIKFLNQSNECIANKSDIINNCNFKIYAVDQFKLRYAFFSVIVCYNSIDDSVIKVKLISQISDRLNEKDQISYYVVSFEVPEEIKSFYFIEYIYNDFFNFKKPNIDNLMPMRVFVQS